MESLARRQIPLRLWSTPGQQAQPSMVQWRAMVKYSVWPNGQLRLTRVGNRFSRKSFQRWTPFGSPPLAARPPSHVSDQNDPPSGALQSSSPCTPGNGSRCHTSQLVTIANLTRPFCKSYKVSDHHCSPQCQSQDDRPTSLFCAVRPLCLLPVCVPYSGP